MYPVNSDLECSNISVVVASLITAPIGTITAWTNRGSAASSQYESLPDGWVLCDGGTIPEPSMWAGKDATMVGFWEKSQKSDQMPYFGQNLVGFEGLQRNLEEFSRNSEIYLHDNVFYLHIYFEYCCILTLCCHQLQSIN